MTAPDAKQTVFVSFDGKGHDAHQNSFLKEATRFPYELLILEVFKEWVDSQDICSDSDVMFDKMSRRIRNHDTIVMQNLAGWRTHASTELQQRSDKLHDRFMRYFEGKREGNKSKFFFEKLRGTVSSGDAHPTTHGNTIGLIFLWAYIIQEEFGWDIIEEELNASNGQDYTLPIRVNFCGDDGIFTTCKAVGRYIQDIILPNYFVTENQQDHGSGTIIRDFVMGPIEEHGFLSKQFYDIDNHIYVTVDFKKMMTKLQYYSGDNQHIRAYPGLKTLQTYLQFKGSSTVVDAILLLTSEALGLPKEKGLALKIAEELW